MNTYSSLLFLVIFLIHLQALGQNHCPKFNGEWVGTCLTLNDKGKEKNISFNQRISQTSCDSISATYQDTSGKWTQLFALSFIKPIEYKENFPDIDTSILKKTRASWIHNGFTFVSDKYFESPSNKRGYSISGSYLLNNLSEFTNLETSLKEVSYYIDEQGIQHQTVTRYECVLESN